MTASQAMGTGGGKGSSANLLNAGAASAALTAARAQATLQQSTAAVTAMKNLQAQARNVSASSGAQNGLALGWLEPYALNSKGVVVNGIVNGVPNTSTWSGASITSYTPTSVNITQSQQSAYLYWKSFSVGPQTTLSFLQSGNNGDAGTWIAFNKVMGASANPTKILGSISAKGQVYILNQNGILFGNGSQVNTHALVASTLPINETLAGDALDGVTASGIVNFPNNTPQFLFDAVHKTAYDPNGKGNVTVSGSIGDVVVESGASILSPANAENTGGLVALVGPNVHNYGSISTPNGQTVLAAGLQVALTPHPSGDPSLRGLDVTVGEVVNAGIQTHSVETGADSTGATGTAGNSGYISIIEGDATMAGASVNQAGVIDSSTSVSLNGRIDLLASYNAVPNPLYNPALQGGSTIPFNAESTGSVLLGPGSVTRILPEWNSTATVTGTALSLSSIVSIIGSTIELQQGAIIEAPGASSIINPGAQQTTAEGQAGQSLAGGVGIQAGTWQLINNTAQLAYLSGGITLDSGSSIDVSGSTDVQVQSSQNFITLQLRGAELANSPLQQSSSVRGQNITIDTRITGTYTYDGVSYDWVGTPLGDTTGYLGLIERTVGQFTEQGGTVSLMAGSEVTTASSSSINVSGGWAQYSGGKFSTTDLVYQGHLMNITQATPDRVYSGIYSGENDIEAFSKWGVTKVFESPLDPSLPHNEASYIQGANGGSILIQAPSEALNGELFGNTVTGPRQLRVTATLSTLPTASSLTLNLEMNDGGTLSSLASGAPNVIFASNASSTQNTLVLPPSLLSGDGFGILNVLDHDGSITVPSGVVLNAGVGGSVTLEGANLDIEGSIIAPAGSVSLTADLAPYNVLTAVQLNHISPLVYPYTDVVKYTGPNQPGENLSTGEIVAQYGPSGSGGTGNTQILAIEAGGAESHFVSVPTADLEHLNAGVITLGPSASISTAGILANDSPMSPQRYLPTAINGGSISVTGDQVNLNQGSSLNVSGGAINPASGSLSYGNAGSITINAGQDTSLKDIHEGALQLGATLEGYAGVGKTAGALSISAPAFQIGGGTSAAGVIALSPGFFSEGGFGTFNLTGLGREIAGTGNFTPGIDITAGTLIEPQVSASIVEPSAAGMVMEPFSPPSPYGSTANLTLSSTGLADSGLLSPILIPGNFMMGQGVSIIINPQLVSQSSGTPLATGGSVTLNAGKSSNPGYLAVLGSIIVPGGTISLNGYASFPLAVEPSAPPVTLDLAPSARLSTAGVALYGQDPEGQRQLFGALLNGGSITLAGNILAEAGAVMDASGASGVYDLFPSQLGVTRPTGSGGGKAMASPVPTALYSDGGSITLNGTTALYSDATLIAHSGGPGASGGSLTISSGRYYNQGETLEQVADPVNPNLVVSQGGPSLPGSFQYSGLAALGQSLPASGGIPDGGGHITVDSFSSGGFENVTLGGNVLFNGPISISVPGSLYVASTVGTLNGGVISAESSVNAPISLTASYIHLGGSFVGPIAAQSTLLTDALGYYSVPVYGPSTLTANAELVDVGNLLLQNIGTANINTPNGVIRGDGTLDIAGTLNLTAAQVYPATDTVFNLVAYDHGGVAGQINIQQSGGALPLPLSAGGTISLYASTITQGGTLVAPLGTINLGVTGTSLPQDPIAGTSVPISKNLTLTSGSLTSVSAVDPLTGSGITIPFGTSVDGSVWTDPSGTAITSLPQPTVTLNSQNIVTAQGSIIDLQGGGNVTANQWISGNGGNINMLGNPSPWDQKTTYSAGELVTTVVNGVTTTWSARQGSIGTTPKVGLYWTELPTYYAIIPGYQPTYEPTGYATGLSVGSQVTLGAGSGLPAGTYTLLPASYATQPGAYLISVANSTMPADGTDYQPDASVLVSGILGNSFKPGVKSPTPTLFQILSPSAIAARVQYSVLNGNNFFEGSSSPLPVNAGHLVFQSTSSMALNGSVLGNGGAGTGAVISISTPGSIDITPDGTGGIPGSVVLGASQLSSWDFASLLIGGVTGTVQNGVTPVSVSAENINLEAGSALSGNDIILAANQGVTLDPGNGVLPGASISSPGNVISPDEQISVSGNGAVVRVSGDSQASVTRNFTYVPGNNGEFSIGSGVTLTGSSLSLNSSGGAFISSSTVNPPLLTASTINVNAGQLDISFDNIQRGGALNLGENVLGTISTASSLNLNSYSSINFYGVGTLGSASLASLGLHAGEILGNNASSDNIEAVKVLLDNANSATDPSGGSPSATGGSLAISGSVLTLGAGNLSIGGFQDITATMSGGVEGSGVGVLATGDNLTINTPVLTGAASASTTIQAVGAVNLTSGGSAAVTSGLGAVLTLRGSTLSVGTDVEVPSGRLSIEATTGDLTVSSTLDASGGSKTFFDTIEYTSGGSISLSSDLGNLILAGSTLNVGAPAGGTTAGSLSLSAPNGTLYLSGTPGSPSANPVGPNASVLAAYAPANGTAGSFTANLQTFNNASGASDLGGLEGALTSGNFIQSQNIEIRNGDVTVAAARAYSYTLTSDAGSIDVTGAIDASMVPGADAYGNQIFTGGSISLFAGKSVVLSTGALLDAHGTSFDSAGKGGSISIEAGNNPALGSAGIAPAAAGTYDPSTYWVADLSGGSINLSINLPAGESPLLGQASGTLLIGAPQTGDNNDVQVDPILTTITGASAINVVGVYRQDAATVGTAVIDPGTMAANDYEYNAFLNVQAFLNNNNNYNSVVSRIIGANTSFSSSILQVNAGEEIDNTLGSLVLNNIWDLSTWRTGPSITFLDSNGNQIITGANAGYLTLRASGNITFNASLSDGFGDGNNALADIYNGLYYQPGVDPSLTYFGGGQDENYADAQYQFGWAQGGQTPAGGLAYAPLLPIAHLGTSLSGSLVSQSSWSYVITAGGNLQSANPGALNPKSAGDVSLGLTSTTSNWPEQKTTAEDMNAFNYNNPNNSASLYQVIRTGTGNISISASGNLDMLNQFASIYTAGALSTDPTLGGTFDAPLATLNSFDNILPNILPSGTRYPAQYSYGGGNIAVNVIGNIQQQAQNSHGVNMAASDLGVPTSWLDRRGAVDATTGYYSTLNSYGVHDEIQSTTWWIDFSNFFDDFGTLGGGNIILNAGLNISNINASIPTQARTPGYQVDVVSSPAGEALSTIAAANGLSTTTLAAFNNYTLINGDRTIANGTTVKIPIVASAASLVETGGGNLTVAAGNNIDGGIYYVERGNGSLQAGGSIITNPTRDPNNQSITGVATGDSALSYLPTTLFLGKGSFNVQAAGSLLLGPVANAFLSPQNADNGLPYRDYFSTFASTDVLNVESLGGGIDFRESGYTAQSGIQPMLVQWFNQFVPPIKQSDVASFEPWLTIDEGTISVNGGIPALLSIEPPTLNATALSGGITFNGSYTAAPAASGNITLLADGTITALTAFTESASPYQSWSAGSINLSDANPASVPGFQSPVSINLNGINQFQLTYDSTDVSGVAQLFAESGSYSGSYGTIETKSALNDQSSLLHGNDSTSLKIYSLGGDITGLTLYSSKQADVVAGNNLTDVGLYIQNNRSSDFSIVSAGGNIILYDPNSPLQLEAQSQNASGSSPLQNGDVQISGPGTLEVLAGANVNLGNNPGSSSGDPTLNVGITSIGNSRNPALPLQGADIVVGAGVALPEGLSSANGLALENFATTVLKGTGGTTYLSELADTMTYSGDPLPDGALTAASFDAGSTQLSNDEKARLELQLFYIVLRDAGRQHNVAGSPGYGTYAAGEAAIRTFFGSSSAGTGSIEMWSQDISTLNGGNVDIFAPQGGLSLASISSKSSSGVAPGVITEGGGTIDIFTQENVSLGIGRIFTLKGGDIMIWSDKGNIAAGASSKTVASAPPTQVLIDPQSGNVETDLAGLATGGGIGVLATVEGIPPGNVDLIAPSGVIDAGDAGIRSSGNINLAATKILNANNIAASGSTSGAPAAPPPPAAPNIGGASAASAASAANNSAAQNATSNRDAVATEEQAPSVISVEVLGYGGGEGTDDSGGDDQQQKKKSAGGSTPPTQAAL